MKKVTLDMKDFDPFKQSDEAVPAEPDTPSSISKIKTQVFETLNIKKYRIYMFFCVFALVAGLWTGRVIDWIKEKKEVKAPTTEIKAPELTPPPKVVPLEIRNEIKSQMKDVENIQIQIERGEVSIVLSGIMKGIDGCKKLYENQNRKPSKELEDFWDLVLEIRMSLSRTVAPIVTIISNIMDNDIIINNNDLIEIKGNINNKLNRLETILTKFLWINFVEEEKDVKVRQYGLFAEKDVKIHVVVINEGIIREKKAELKRYQLEIDNLIKEISDEIKKLEILSKKVAD